MPTNLAILGWKAKGLRCPDHEIDCRNVHGDPNKITLIQMPNGTGKTTTLSLLRAALSGAATNGEPWTGAAITEFQKRGGENDQPGVFEVNLLLNGRRATIIMEFDFGLGHITYKTTYGPGQRIGFHPPADFRRFLNPSFVNFFVFDGELAQRLLDRAHTNAEAAVETLFQVNTFSLLQQRVKDYWTSQTAAGTATEERGRTRRENRVEKLEARIAELRQQKRDLETKQSDLRARLRNREDAYNQAIQKDEALAESIGKADLRSEQLKASVREDAIVVLDAMRDPFALSPVFATAIAELKSGLDRVKLPDSAAREFFRELADEAECVCGRPIDELIKAAIRERASHYLASDDVLFLNAMKTAIQEAVGTSLTAPERALQEKLSTLEKSMDDQREAANTLDQLRLQAEQSDPEVQRAKVEIERLRNDLGQVEDRLQQFESKDQQQSDENTHGLEILEKRLKDAEKKLAEITQTIVMKDKRDVLLAILADSHRRARLAMTREICDDTNQRLLALLPYNNISVKAIDRSLVLEGQDGGSVGETLSVAYAFLSTLFNRSEHHLPFIVDSPAGPIDLAVRPKIAELIPKLTSQFIAFTISSERDSFVPRLKAAGNGEIQFITLFRKGPKDLQRAARATAGAIETTDSLLVVDEGFFNDFQIDQEAG